MPELINLEFEMMFPNEWDNFLSKWGTNFSEQIIEVRKHEYPPVQEVIEDFLPDGDRGTDVEAAARHMQDIHKQH